MPNSTTITGEKWFRCARSGWWFPVSERVWENGLPIADRFTDEPGRDALSGNPTTTEFADRVPVE